MPTIYQTQTRIPSFGGINQSTDGYNMSLRYAQFAANADVTGGGLTPMRAGVPIAQTVAAPIGTLARLHRRYHATEGEKDVLVAIAGGKVYTKLYGHEDAWAVRYSSLTENNCDWVTYEVNKPDSDAPTDVLLFTNAKDGMFCLYGDNLQVTPVETPYKFGVLARFNERIWGSGIADDPDKLVYSVPFDPFDWKQNSEIPEDGGGEIMQPSWDGDSFLALRTFGSQLLAIKKNAIWRVLGTNPGEFVMKEQYGGGALEENTIAVTGSYALMLGYGGLMRYDGADTSPFQQQSVREIMAQVNPEARSHSYAVMDGKRYLLALPLGKSTENNAVLEYNITEQSFSLMRGVGIKSFLAFDGTVLYTSASAPGTVYVYGGGEVLPVTWASGYQDLGMKHSVKSAFMLYFTAAAEKRFLLTLGVRTEKKLKQKEIMVTPGKSHRVILNVSGRYFRVEIGSRTTTPWQLNGGIEIDMELDPD